MGEGEVTAAIFFISLSRVYRAAITKYIYIYISFNQNIARGFSIYLQYLII